MACPAVRLVRWVRACVDELRFIHDTVRTLLDEPLIRRSDEP